MALINYLKAGIVVLPEIKSLDGKLTFLKELDLTSYEPFTKLITNIIALNGNPSMQMKAICDCNNEYEIFDYFFNECYYSNEKKLLDLLYYAIWLREIEFNNGLGALLIDDATLEKLLLYNGQPITKAELDTAIFEYRCAIDLIKKNRLVDIEASKHYLRPEVVEDMKKYLTPEVDNGLLSWIFNFMKTKELK